MKNEIIRRRNTPSNKKRRFCIVLALLMIFGAVMPVLPAMTVSAAAESDAEAEKQSRIAAVKEVLNAVSYPEYLRANSDYYLDGSDAPVIDITPADAILDDPETAAAENAEILEKGGNFVEEARKTEEIDRTALYFPDKGAVSFRFEVPAGKAGLYNLEITYLQVVGKTSSIERMVKIDGKVPFREARYITMTKTYVDNYLYLDYDDKDENGNPRLKLPEDIADFDREKAKPQFAKDIKDNEIRPSKSESPEWRTVLTEDSTGFVKEPFLYYLTEGEHILTLEAVKEAVYISGMRFVVSPNPPTYEQYKAMHPDVKGTADLLIQAETPAATSEITIYPLNDRTSAITQPQDASRIRLNSIGSDKWQLTGQWIRYEFDVPEGGGGWYYIVPRFKQSVNQGVYSSRKIKLDGKVPFEEANSLRFNFNDSWQVEPLSDGSIINPEAKKKDQKKQYFEFYLTEGRHTIEFEVVLGDMAELLGQVEVSVMNLNEMYRKIRMITGPTPDNNRDYGFARKIPTVLEGMHDESENLTRISDQLEAVIGTKGEQTVMLDRMSFQLANMANDTDRIAPGMESFKTNIGSMATWLLERRNQPLEIDYIKIQPPGEKLPQAEANFLEAVGFEFTSFIMSFFSDYNSQGAMTPVTKESKRVEVWLGSEAPVMGGLTLAGRDQAQVLRQLVVDFTVATDIQVDVKLVAVNSLLPSVLAGVGPDVALANGGDKAVNYAIRSAVLPLNGYGEDMSLNSQGKPKDIKGFDEVRTYFMPSALVPLTLHEEKYYCDSCELFFGQSQVNMKEYREYCPDCDAGLKLKPLDPSELRVYGLPECQTFPMMFYRKDIFVELGLEVPTTWNELYKIVPVLQKKHFDIGITPGMQPLTALMFQQNTPLYKGDGIEINLGSNLALDSFKQMTKFYTDYKFPIQFDVPTRFRAGDMPLAIASYELYNQLTVFAPEIRGLWEFVPLPGTVRRYDPELDAGIDYKISPVNDAGVPEEGWIIDNSSPAGVICSLMMRSSAAKNNDENAWAFMQWWVSAETQGRYGSELIATMGASAKYPTANVAALNNMPWPAADAENLQEQFKYLKAVPEVPGGSYIVKRYVDFAWTAVYNSGVSPVERIQDYLPDIDKELTRKRQEFDMPVIQRDREGKKIVDTE